MRRHELTTGDDGWDPQDTDWLEADLGGPLPPYEWGEKGVPSPVPVRYVRGVGLVIERCTCPEP